MASSVEEQYNECHGGHSECNFRPGRPIHLLDACHLREDLPHKTRADRKASI